MDSLKEFQQKIKNRKFAIDHSWKGTGGSWDARHSAGGVASSESAENAFDHLPWDKLNENLEAADACKYFSGYWPLESNRRVFGKAIVFIKRAIRKLLKIFMGWYIFPHYQQMSHFNGKVVNVISLEREILSMTVQQTQQISQRLATQESGVQTLQSDLTKQEQETKATFSYMQEQMEGVQSKLRQQEESALAGMQELTNKIEQLLRENEQLKMRLKKLENLPTDDDAFYHDFEEKFRGSQDLIRERLRVYIPVLQKHIPDWSQGRFVDVGSGRGEWLDILRENGASDYVGVDLNARQNAICEERGHHVVQMDCIQYLASLPDNSVDLVSGFQIIEHLCMSDLMDLLQESHRVLKPGGMVLFETPNPKNLMVGADMFYTDPSHKRPLDPTMVSFLVEWCGYTQVQCIDANSHPWSARLEIPHWTEDGEERQLLKEFNDMKWLLYGPQDYAVIGVKEKER